MKLDTGHLQRCLRTLKLSLDFYQRAAALTVNNDEAASIDAEIFRNATVKGFELAQETAIKLVKKALRAYGHGGRKLDELFVKDILRLAATHGLMTLDEVERWFAYRDNRNDTAHDYGVGFAEATLRLLPGFLTDAEALEARLREKFSDGDEGDA